MRRLNVILLPTLLLTCSMRQAPASAGQEAKATTSPLKFETYTDVKEEFRWRLRSNNGQVIAVSGQGYKDKRDRANAIERIKKDARTLKFEQYDDAKGEIRWRLKSSNGQVIATSGQGYKDKRDCENAIEFIRTGAHGAKVEESRSAEKPEAPAVGRG
ncbi:tryptophanyl-tRNA synthetase [Aquisphaera giovannonii]|uniref:Tryptophanyl-tRNA synthetase n=2 Tax=Aquisphaera giovannonii TaxID=406548 RepID=A0A5B9WBB2_9BACT|nr:tryptophanyl-tRNA synthetase [Aquisphaera giovannonii]